MWSNIFNFNQFWFGSNLKSGKLPYITCSCRSISGYSFVPIDILNNSTGGPLDNSTSKVGCNYHKQSWCLDQPKIYLFQYVAGLYILTPGYCASSLICYTMFSKILGPRPQVG